MTNETTQWTPTPPTEPGWYWGKDIDGVTQVVLKFNSLNYRLVGVFEWQNDYEIMDRIKLWCGPIQPPAMPGEEG